MEPHLRLYPGQQVLTLAQEEEARRFFAERFQAQLSTEPVDEEEAEALLRRFYQVVKLPPPHIQWVNDPLQLVALTAPPGVWARDQESLPMSLGGNFMRHMDATFRANGGASKVSVSDIWSSLRNTLRHWMWEGSVHIRLRSSILGTIRASIVERIPANIEDSLWGDINESYQNSVEAYFSAPRFALAQFCAAYLAPSDLTYLAQFNELVSGYRLGTEGALIVRRPLVLSRDEAGRLHSATGKAIQYPDGWGRYVWHGVRVPERVVLAPERLAHEDFLQEPSVEVRRVIQERMGGRFVAELGGQVIDHGSRGTLYEVRLPADDPEGVAHYVQVQDASTERQYFLRVPPTVRTAAEAVAWSFQVALEEYHPTQET